MKSFKIFITEKLKVTNNNLSYSVKDADLKHIANMLSDYIKFLARQNDKDIENIINELKHNTIYDCLSSLHDSVEEFIHFFNINSVKKYNEKELEMIISDYENELVEMLVIDLNR